jgi:alpha-D-ribose 1-methylphosphonate 5-triphosphate synthase subunit PhnH
VGNVVSIAPISTTLLPGFNDPVGEASLVFRVLLEAMGHPGRIGHIGADLRPLGDVHSATLATLLTLADADAPVCLFGPAGSELPNYLRFHCGCPIASDPNDAAFGLITDPALVSKAFQFPIGTDEYPDTSATVIVQVASLIGGRKQTIKGPGIKSTAELAPTLPAEFWTSWRANAQLYPCGIDIIFTCENDVVALPRSSRLED